MGRKLAIPDRHCTQSDQVQSIARSQLISVFSTGTLVQIQKKSVSSSASISLNTATPMFALTPFET